MVRIEYMPLAALKANPRNPKSHDVGAIQASVGRFGFRDAVILDERTGQILSGHGRVEMLTRMAADGSQPPGGVDVVDGQWSVPVQRGWASANDAEADAFVIAINRTNELGGWDEAKLERLLVDLAAQSALVGTGYDGDDIDRIINEAKAAIGLTDPDALPEVVAVTVKKGDIFELGDHRVLCGDSTRREDVELVMGGEKASVCLTDPPYGLGDSKASGKNSYDEYVDSRANLEDLARKWLPLARDVAPVVCFSPGVTNAWIYPEASWVMCWFYGAGSLRSSWGFNCWQPFLCYGRDPSLASGHGCRPDAVDMNTPANASDLAHPCPKPVKLWVWLIERLSFARSDVFYEPFSGSGTTIIACEQLGRKCRAIELSPAYVQLTIARWEAFTGRKAVKL